MKYFDAFAGIGGFSVAIHNASKDAECVAYSEIDKPAIAVYEKHFKGVPNFGDITKINTEELPDFDCLVGGIPCQPWSVAGKRGGFSDDRGNMWWHFIRILKEKRPTYFVAENVKGILTHDKGRSFEILCEAFCDIGYAIDFELLNSKNFGVPQNRQRVIIIGIREDRLAPIGEGRVKMEFII